MPRHKLDWPTFDQVGDTSNMTIVEVSNTYTQTKWVLLTNDGKLWCWTRDLETAFEIATGYAMGRRWGVR